MPEKVDSEYRNIRTNPNIAVFGAMFTATQIAEYVGDKLYQPEVMNVPHGAVISLGLGVSALTAYALDKLDRKES